MADGDGYTRITLRIPVETHAALSAAARDKSHSLNAEIIARLEADPVPASADPIVSIERMFSAFSPNPPAPADFLRALRFHLDLEEAALEQAARMKEAEAGGEMWPTWMSRFFLVERIKQRIKELEA